MTFAKGDRVVVVHAEKQPYAHWPSYIGVEGTVIINEKTHVIVQVDNRFIAERPGASTGPWSFLRSKYELALIDEPIVEEDWS